MIDLTGYGFVLPLEDGSIAIGMVEHNTEKTLLLKFVNDPALQTFAWDSLPPGMQLYKDLQQWTAVVDEIRKVAEQAEQAAKADLGVQHDSADDDDEKTDTEVRNGKQSLRH